MGRVLNQKAGEASGWLEPLLRSLAAEAKAGHEDPAQHWSVRMHRASRLPRESNRTLADVAAAVGYDSESSFSRVFRRRLGASPEAFRRAARVSSRA